MTAFIGHRHPSEPSRPWSARQGRFDTLIQVPEPVGVLTSLPLCGRPFSRGCRLCNTTLPPETPLSFSLAVSPLQLTRALCPFRRSWCSATRTCLLLPAPRRDEAPKGPKPQDPELDFSHVPFPSLYSALITPGPRHRFLLPGLPLWGSRDLGSSHLDP